MEIGCIAVPIKNYFVEDFKLNLLVLEWICHEKAILIILY
jgi:hypothetical protein